MSLVSWGLLGVAALLSLLAPRLARAQAAAVAAPTRVQVTYNQLPLAFETNEANDGQTASPVKFLARGPGYTLWLTPTEAVLTFPRHRRSSTSPAATEQSVAPMVRMTLLGAHPDPQVIGMEALPGHVHYVRGRDPAHWHTRVPTYAKVHYQVVYPGIDLVYYGHHGQLEFDFVVAPGADPTRIQLGLQGADRVDVDAQGDLLLRLGGGELRLHQPRIYQAADSGTQVIPGRYVVLPPPSDMSRREGIHRVGIHVDAYDPSQPLIIDPVLSYATYLGGGADDAGRGIAVDTTGATYVIGETASADFPITPGVVQSELSGGSDVFVAKLTPDGTALVYATYLGGGADDFGRGIAVDATGAAYVTGETASADFPTTPAVIQPALGGFVDAFVAKLAPDGASLIYATFLGGGDFDGGRAVAVDAAGAAYVTGDASADFPVTPGAVQPTLNGFRDAFVTKLAPEGTALVYSTYLGGSSAEIGNGMAVDAAGAAYLTGETSSPDFPTTAGVFQATSGGFEDAFVAKLAPDGAALLYATYLGGSSSDFGQGIAVDATGAAYVTGTTGDFFAVTNDFPTTLGAVQPTFGGFQDAFVAKLAPDGTALVYSTYLGGTQFDGGQGIAVDAAGAAYVMGATDSSEFPTAPDAIQPTLGGEADSFITALTPSGVGLAFSTYLGGSSFDFGMGISGQIIAVDAAGAMYVTWGTNSPDFPTTPGVVQSRLGGGTDAFVAKIVLQLPPEDVVTIRQALFVDRLALLVVVATSSAAPDAELFVTVPECFQRVPMSQVNDRYLLARTAPECEDLDGHTALVTSNHGGSASAPLR